MSCRVLTVKEDNKGAFTQRATRATLRAARRAASGAVSSYTLVYLWLNG